METTIIALSNRVVVEPDPSPERIGEIVVPTIAMSKVPRGTILSVGPEGTAAGLKEKDYVLYSLYAGQKAKLGDKEVLVLFVSEIHGKIIGKI